MIEDRAVERLGCGYQPPRRPQVAVAGPWIAARMIVREDDSRATVPRGVEDDLADWESRAGFIALVTGKMEAARVVVDVGDPQALPPGISLGEATRKEVARRHEAV